MELMTAETVEPVMRDAGHPDPAGCASHVDDTMKAAILRLYRSAVDVGTEWDPGTRGRERPGLVLWGRDDPFAKPTGGEVVAAAANAPLRVFTGGHWAIFEHPDETARVLEELWSEA
jgi:pimeloyl-ACP methyl ester carboxylesterase